MRRAAWSTVGRGHGTRSITTSRSDLPGTSTPSRSASVPSREARGSSRKISTRVPASIGSTCWASSGSPARASRSAIRAWTALQPLDRGEQAQRPAARRLDQPRIGAGQRRYVAAADVGDDQHFGAGRVIERAFRLEMRRRARQMHGAGARLGRRPVARPPRKVAEVTSTPSAGRQHRAGQRPGRVEPAAVDRDVIFAPLDALDRQPVDELGIGRAADPPEQGDPRGERLAPPGEAADRALDPRPRLARRASRAHPRAPPRAAGQAPPAASASASSASQRRRRRGDQRAVGLGQLGLQPVARFLRLGPRVDRPAHLGEQRLDRRRMARLRPPAAASRRMAAPAPPRPPLRAPGAPSSS